MTALVAVETVLLALLVLLVAGLLRSHAEILRRLGPERQGSQDAEPPLPEPPATRSSRAAERPAPALSGTTAEGDAVTLDFRGGAGAPTLLAFLSSGCSTCAAFWETLGERRLPADVELAIVTRDADRERPSKLRALAPAQVPVVMSSRAWEEYGVPGAPYFVLVDGVVRGEGAAGTWQALGSLLADAIEDEREAGRSGGEARARRIDATLAAGGIGQDHPSLYPGVDPGGNGDRHT